MSAVQVPPYTDSYFGYDGPWQAVTVNVGGFDNGTTASSQWTTVQVLPGGTYSSWFIPPTYCSNNVYKGDCGIGGEWDPGSQQTQSQMPVDYEPTLSSSGLFAQGEVYIEDLSFIDLSGQTYTAPNVTLALIDEGQQTWPNGANTSIQLGVLSLGAPRQQQSFSESTTNSSILPITGWLLPAWLYNTSITPSYSFSLQLGSVALQYPISLWFGGYDKSRAIGPYTTWASTPPRLLDMTIGVETGGSPFNFSLQQGLLLDNTTVHAPITVGIDSLSSGLYLPQQTCDNLVKNLPVAFDQNLGYYMWNTSAPSYANITSSPAYLGFVFPPAAGSLGNVTIKVPFRLLNLSLDPLISGLGVSAPYFPCFSLPSDDNSYVLGRAFLQAAFWASNWKNSVSWLAQAPGPGLVNSGLGNPTPTDIQSEDTGLDLFSDPSLFAASWSSVWTVLPESDGSNGQTGSSTNTNAGLSTGAKAGIGVGVGLGVLLLLIAAAIFARNRFRKRRRGGDGVHGEETKDDFPPFQDDPTRASQHPGQWSPLHDMNQPRHSVYAKQVEHSQQPIYHSNSPPLQHRSLHPDGPHELYGGLNAPRELE